MAERLFSVFLAIFSSVVLLANIGTAQFWDDKADEVNYTREEIANWIGLPDNYTTFSAIRKAEALWKVIKQTSYTRETLPVWDTGAGGWFHFLRVAFVSLSPAFYCNRDNGDVFPTGHIRGIHNLGVVGRARIHIFENITQNNFTGMLAQATMTEAIVR